LQDVNAQKTVTVGCMIPASDAWLGWPRRDDL